MVDCHDGYFYRNDLRWILFTDLFFDERATTKMSIPIIFCKKRYPTGYFFDIIMREWKEGKDGEIDKRRSATCCASC